MTKFVKNADYKLLTGFHNSIFCEIRVCEYSNEIKIWLCKIQKFPGLDSREILHYVKPTLESGNCDTAVLQFGVNDLMQKALSKSDTVENVIENIRKAAVKYMSHGPSKAFVSGIVRNKRIPELVLEEVK